jgi:SAM-dependent methyltransferase
MLKSRFKLEKQYLILLKWLRGKEFQRPLRMLEIGAGNMCIKRFLQKNITYDSMDFGSNSDPNLKYDSNYTYLFNLDNKKMPIKDSTYDLIVCFETLEHTLYPKQVLREIKRISKKDATLFFSMPNEYNFIQRIYHFLGKKTFCDEPFELVEKHLHIHKPRVCDIISLFSKDFRIVDLKYAWQSNKLPNFLENIVNSLAQLMPALFARIVVVKCKNYKP